MLSTVRDIAIDITNSLFYILKKVTPVHSAHMQTNIYNKTMMTTQRVFRIEEFGRPLPRTMTGKIRRYELLRRYQ